MTEFETKLLISLKAMSEQHVNQAELLTALSLSQSQTTQQLAALSSHQESTSINLSNLQVTVGQVLQALSKEPSGESLEATLKAALQPLQKNLEQLIESFNKLANFSQELSEQLPSQPVK